MTWTTIQETLSAGMGSGLVRAGLVIAMGLVLARLVSRGVAKAVAHHTQAEQPRILQRLVFYAVVLLTVVFALSQLGFDMGVLLGAAGVLTVAVGFAAQTSFSNIISGLFLVGERPFKEGDYIVVGDAAGTVHAIDLLAVTLRTPDNLAVRVPNEIFIKSSVTNYSRFPIRRIDLFVGVAYAEDLERVVKVVTEAVRAHPSILEDPAEKIFFEDFGDSSVNFKVSAWVDRESFFDVKRQLALAIRAALTQAGVEIPFPQRTLHIAAGPALAAPSPPLVGAGDDADGSTKV